MAFLDGSVESQCGLVLKGGKFATEVDVESEERAEGKVLEGVLELILMRGVSALS